MNYAPELLFNLVHADTLQSINLFHEQLISTVHLLVIMLFHFIVMALHNVSTAASVITRVKVLSRSTHKLFMINVACTVIIKAEG